jgi:hypothetical protein
MACPISRVPARSRDTALKVTFDSAASAGWVCCAKTHFPGPPGRGLVIDFLEISQISSFCQNGGWRALHSGCRSNCRRDCAPGERTIIGLVTCSSMTSKHSTCRSAALDAQSSRLPCGDNREEGRIPLARRRLRRHLWADTTTAHGRLMSTCPAIKPHMTGIGGRLTASRNSHRKLPPSHTSEYPRKGTTCCIAAISWAAFAATAASRSVYPG